MKVSTIRQILHHVENAPIEIQEIFKNGLKWYLVKITGCEFQANVPCTDLNLSWGLKSLRESFLKKLVDDFEAGKGLPFEIETD
jgi:hypothetical protein